MIINIDGDIQMLNCLLVSTVEIVVAIIAVIVAVASAVIALVFGLSQRKFNINSVRPIPQIYIGKLVDEIYVKLANVGTGPLHIKRLRFKKNGVESDNLRDLLTDVFHYIDNLLNKNKPLTNIRPPICEYIGDSIDNETISINSSEELLMFKNLDKNIYDKLCASLAEITMTLEYQDVYNKSYQYESTNFKSFAKKRD